MRTRLLPAAAALAAAEATVIIVVLVVRGGDAVPLLVPLLALKYPFCLGLLRRSPTSWFGLLLWELAGMLAAVTAPRTPVAVRLAELAAAAAVTAMLAVASPLFPTVRLPARDD